MNSTADDDSRLSSGGGAAGGDVGAKSAPATKYVFDVSQSEVPIVPTTDLVRVDRAEQLELDIRGRQEWVRTALAVGAFLSLVLILGMLLIAVYPDMSPENIEQVATVVVTPLTGIVGTIIGFYFAERRGGRSGGPSAK